MSIPLDLVRDDLRGFAGYRSARSEKLAGRIWLNANESPWPSPADHGPADSDASLRRYPDPQPAHLRERLASLYDCDSRQLLAGRGSDEGIDLLVRALCRPGQDAVLITSPTFGMYAVCARLHGTRVIDVPLRDSEHGFVCDFDALAAVAEAEAVKLVFLCSPGNPSGTLLPLDAILALARRLEGRAMVVVDEAYIEYARAPSAISLIDAQPNIAVLRTLSKAHALAAARIGAVIADAALIDILQRCQAPYPLPAPCVALACEALAAQARATTAGRIEDSIDARERMQAMLSTSPDVHRVYPSRANFVLARFNEPQATFERLLAAGIVVRDLRMAPQLGDALRISIGTPQQNDAVAGVLNARQVTT